MGEVRMKGENEGEEEERGMKSKRERERKRGTSVWWQAGERVCAFHVGIC